VDRILLCMLQGEGKLRYSVMVQWQWNVNGGGVDLSVLMSCCKLCAAEKRNYGCAHLTRDGVGYPDLEPGYMPKKKDVLKRHCRGPNFRSLC
jgi:hypothetical protein